MKKIIFLPIDNRPLTYCLTAQIAAVYKKLNLVLPQRSLLGGLVTASDWRALLKWLEAAENPDFIILSLDSSAYGGLVSSRRGKETLEEIKSRLEILKKILKDKKQKNPALKIYATSSIMRISNNNENEEEKEYWKDFGKKIFEFSYNTHKNGAQNKGDIPLEILEDYLETRARNFKVNKLYLDWLEENILDFLVYSKDDTGEYGLNVQEAENLALEIQRRNLKAIVKTGADEIPLGLLLRAITGDLELKIKVVYKNPDSVDKISRYEDVSIQDCTKAQIGLGVPHARFVNENQDIILYVNNFKKAQGDWVFQDVINIFEGDFPKFEAPFVVADINNANGADNPLVESLLAGGYDKNFLGYSGCNTSANSIGSALAIGIITYLARKTGDYDELAFKKLISTRFLDDWAYQANIRKNVQKGGGLFGFEPFEEKIKNFTGANFAVEYKLPWSRSFEIEIGFKNGNKI